MTKLFKSSFDTDELSLNLNKFAGYVSSSEAKRLISLPTNLSEDDVVDQRDLIEKCASSNSVYFYNNKWSKETVGQLKEYACVCGCECRGIDPNDEKVIEMSQEKEGTIKEASASPKNSLVLKDPFEREIDTSYLNKIDWQKITPASKVGKPNTMMTSSSVISIGGGEDPLKNPRLNVRRGQNSVAVPDSIGKIIENKKVDVGVRLREEANNRSEFRKSELKATEKQMVQEAEAKGFGSLSSKGKIIVTETLNAQPGIRGKGAFNFDLPDQTKGESLKNQNAARKESIQREAKTNDREWDNPQGSSKHVISSDLIDSLRENLSKIAKK